MVVAVSSESILVLELNDGLRWGSGVSEGLLFGGSGGIGLTSVRLVIRGVNWADGLLVFGTGGGGSLLDRLVLPGLAGGATFNSGSMFPLLWTSLA